MVPSIYDHIKTTPSPDSPLPDSPFTSPTTAGAADAMGPPRIVLRPESPGVTEVLEALVTLSSRPGQRSRRRLESVMRAMRCLDLVDPLMDAVRSDTRITRSTLYSEARKLAMESHWREMVKLSIALLGLYKQESDAPLVETLGSHEEFTLWAVVTLGNMLPDPVPAWMRLASHTRGWGKVHAVRRLTRQAHRSEVRHWLLRYGCANRIAANLLALDIASSCRLHEALAEQEPGDVLLDGARHILNGLLEHGLAPGMASYTEGAEASLLWVMAVEGRPARLPEFLTLSALRHWVERPGHGWPEGVATECDRRVCAMLGDPAYADLALADLEHPDPTRAWTAREVARRLGLPVYHRLLPLLQANPSDEALWAYTTAAASPEQLDSLPPLLPPGNREALSTLLRALRRAPGTAAATLLSSLTDEATAIRLLALDVLGRWPVATVPPELALAVMTAVRDDPEGVVRKAARSVVKGWPVHKA